MDYSLSRRLPAREQTLLFSATMPDDYVHRISRTARAEAEGDAFVLVAPAEEKNLARIERQIGQRLPRVTLPDFDYAQAPQLRPERGRHRPRGGGQRAPRTGGDGGASPSHGARRRRR